MADDRYDDLFKQRERERSERERTAEEQDRRRELFGEKYVEWRNDVKVALKTRAGELEKQYQQLGQIFVQDIQDEVQIRKSRHPSGSVYLLFDEDRQRIECEFRFYGSTGQLQKTFAREYELTIATDGDEIVIRDDIRALTTTEFVYSIFDRFVPDII